MKNKIKTINSVVLSTLFLLSIVVVAFKPSSEVFADKALPEITVYKTPTCGCCGKWVSHLESNGFKVTAIDQNDLSSIKRQLGIAPNLQSCHTAKIGNYFIEGHVPAADIIKMLADKPYIKGLTVPGMPMGSPGMEGATKDDYDVLAIKKDQTVTVFNSH